MRSLVFSLTLGLLLPSACKEASKTAASDDESKKKKQKASDDDDEDTPKKKKKASDDDDDEKPAKKKKKSGYVEGPLGFPLPKDAAAPGNAPGGGGKIKTYEVPRARDEVADELEKFLDEAGWTIDSKEKSPMGTRRLSASKDGNTVKASVAGQGEQSAIILSLP